MMLAKIISGGQTGADQAALDIAIKFDISHGGWIPKGRKTESGPLSEKYQLMEMPTASYPKRTERNILESDGTLILSHGKLTGGSALTLKIARKYGHKWLHLNLSQTNIFDAAHLINSWIARHKIRTLNVAGPRVSEDPLIYKETFKVLETTFYLALVETCMNRPVPVNRFPETVAEAVDRLVSELSLKDKIKIARMAEADLGGLIFTVGQYILEQFGLKKQNNTLRDSCRCFSGEDSVQEETAAAVIINALWNRLRQDHLLRVVK
jgi:hypothetical protein